MLKKGIKFILISLLLCGSCNYNYEKKVEIKISDYQLNSNKYVNDNFYTYENIFNIIQDSIETYKKAELANFVNIYDNYWIKDSVKYLEIDSMICINSEGNKLVVTLNYSLNACDDCMSDLVSNLLGKKINNTWYFFIGGGHLIIPRNYYGKDAMHPLSFHELSQIARKNVLESSLIKNAAGEYIVNDKWVDAQFYQNGFGDYKTKEEYDSVHWTMILKKWKSRIDTNEYKPMYRNGTPKPAV